MKKNIRDYKKNGYQFAYILDSIAEEDSNGTLLKKDADRINFFFDCFEKEFNYIQNKLRYPDLQERIAQYLKGLPSCISIPFSNYDIIELGKSWGLCKNEKQEDRILQNYWSTCAIRLIQLKNYYSI